MDDADLNAFARAVTEAVLRLPRAAQGRQNDAGARLQPAGVLIIPLAVDPGVPGAVFSADLVAMKQGRQEWHRTATIRDGEEGGSANVKPAGGDELKVLLGLLSGHAIPGAVGGLVGGGDPLATLMAIRSVFGK